MERIAHDFRRSPGLWTFIAEASALILGGMAVLLLAAYIADRLFWPYIPGAPTSYPALGVGIVLGLAALYLGGFCYVRNAYWKLTNKRETLHSDPDWRVHWTRADAAKMWLYRAYLLSLPAGIVVVLLWAILYS